MIAGYRNILADYKAADFNDRNGAHGDLFTAIDGRRRPKDHRYRGHK